MPGLGSLRTFGTVAANHDNATLALKYGARCWSIWADEASGDCWA